MKKIYLGLIVCLLISLSMGQNITFEQVYQPPYTIADFDGILNGSIVYADIDNDNDLDVLIAGEDNFEQPITKLYSNDGNGNFFEVPDTPFEGVSGCSVGFADIDNDNDQDLLITGENSTGECISKLYSNDGSGNFMEIIGVPFEGVKESSLAFADIDGDYDKDVLISGVNSSNLRITRLYINDGSGSYSSVTPTNPFEGVYMGSIAFADIDNDNDLDLLITGRNNTNQHIAKLYANNGSGVFNEVNGTPFVGVYFGSVAFADIDNDNDQDLLITGETSPFGFIAKLYENNGSGVFSEVSGTPFIGVFNSSIAFADIDSDNDQDVLITGSGFAKLYSNDGSGNFTEISETPFYSVYSSSIAFFDADNDNDQDVVITGESIIVGIYINISKLYTNDGNGSFTEATGSPFERTVVSAVDFADIDNDNDQDLLITGNSATGLIAKLYDNDGTGNFTEITGTPFTSVGWGSVAFADIDNDNDQDVLIIGHPYGGLYNFSAKLYTNNGEGSFTEVPDTPFEGVAEGTVAFADIDNDNDQDVLIAGGANFAWGNANLYINDGTGSFTLAIGTPFEPVISCHCAFADIDDDNDQDLLITGWNNSSGECISKLYANNGSGVFNEINGTPFVGVYYGSVAFADIDNDNDQDLLITGETSPFGLIAKLYSNDGNGNFNEITETTFTGVYRSTVAFADLDNDNDQDVLIAGEDSSGHPITKLYSNDGYGNFLEVSATPIKGVSGSLAMADIDNDNDLDVFIIGYNKSIPLIARLYRNITITTGNVEKITSLNSIKLYPNPSSGSTNLHLVITEQGKVICDLYEISGVRIKQWLNEEKLPGAYEMEIDLSDLLAGVYFCVLKTNEEIQTQKIIKL